MVSEKNVVMNYLADGRRVPMILISKGLFHSEVDVEVYIEDGGSHGWVPSSKWRSFVAQ